MNAVAKRKFRLRARVRAGLKRKARSWQKRASAAIQQRVIAMPQFGAAGVVALYLAKADEARTDLILRSAWRAGKRVCAPAYRDGVRDYRLAWLKPGEALAARRFGVREPRRRRWNSGIEIDLAIVPGRAFDAAGRRLGRGGGFYDRLLALPIMRRALKVGLAFEAQMRDRVPAERRDRRVDLVVTEKKTYGRMKTAGRRRAAGGRHPYAERRGR